MQVQRHVAGVGHFVAIGHLGACGHGDYIRGGADGGVCAYGLAEGDGRVEQRLAGGDGDVVNGQAGKVDRGIAAQVEAQLDILPGKAADIGRVRTPTRTLRDGYSWAAHAEIGHGGAKPLPHPLRAAATDKLYVYEGVIPVGVLDLVLLRPGEVDWPNVAAQVDGGREEILIAAGIVSACQVGDPAVCAAVAGGDGREGGRTPLPLVLDAAGGEAAVICLEVAAEDGNRRCARRAEGRWRRFANGHGPALQDAAIAGQVVVDLQRPRTASVLVIEPVQTAGGRRLVYHARNDRIAPGRDGSLVVQGHIHLLLRIDADVIKQHDLVATWRQQHHVQVGHVGVRQDNCHVQVGDARVARHRQR